MVTRRGIVQRVRELIGNPQRYRSMVRSLWDQTGRKDWAEPTYEFWDRARRGRARGLEVSGLFLAPLASKTAAWVMGQTPKWPIKNETARIKLNKWWSRHHADILRGYEESVGLGNSYLVFNSDLSVTVVPPNVVSPIVDENDFSQIVGWRIQETFPHPLNPGETMTIVDEYTAFNRTRTITQSQGSKVMSRTVYPNLIGIVPVVHIPNVRSADEMFGRPEGESLIPLLQKYGATLEAALDGNRRQGRPTPVISKMGTPQEVDAFWKKFGRLERQENPDGTIETYTVIDFDADQLLTLGGDAEFTYAQPGPFSGDTETLLGLLFYLMLQHTEVPEFVWGNAIQGSKASADAQIEPFTKWIEKKRGYCLNWLIESTTIILKLMSLTDFSMTGVIDELDKGEIVPRWEPLTKGDGRLTLDTIVWALEQGLVDNETALELAPVDVVDIPEVLKKAKKDKEERMKQAIQQAQATARTQGNSTNNSTNPSNSPRDQVRTNAGGNGNGTES